MVDQPEDADSRWRKLPRRYVVWAIVGWFALAATAYGVAWVAGWTALTEGRPLIFLLVGGPYWLTVIALYNRMDRKREDAERS